MKISALLPFAAAPAFAQPPTITDRLLPFPAERQELTARYLAEHQGRPLSGDPDRDSRMSPRLVVLHWTGACSAQSAWSTFAPSQLQGRPELQGASALNVSAHYLVDQEGQIQRLMAEDRVARHVIGLNHVAIGIENVGDGQSCPLLPAQVQANIALIRDLRSRWPIELVIGHQEYRKLEGGPLFIELDPAYRTAKPDPGDAFTAAVRAGLADLGLERAP
jgi:N-acetylmuramoyl-L-alanine amidase